MDTEIIEAVNTLQKALGRRIGLLFSIAMARGTLGFLQVGTVHYVMELNKVEAMEAELTTLDKKLRATAAVFKAL